MRESHEQLIVNPDAATASSKTRVISVIFEWSGSPDYLDAGYRTLMGRVIRQPNDIELVETSRRPTIDDMRKWAVHLTGKYILVVKQGHVFKDAFILEMLKYLKVRTVYLAEPFVYYAKAPLTPKASAIPNSYTISRPSDIYGVAFLSEALAVALREADGVDPSAVYLNYRLYWRLATVRPREITYSYANQTPVTNGIEIDSKSTRLLYEGQVTGSDVRVMILRYLILVIRGMLSYGETGVSAETLGDLVRGYRLAALFGRAELRDRIELAVLRWLGNRSSEMTLYKDLRVDDVYLLVGTDPKQIRGPLLYTLKFADEDVYVSKAYRPHSERADLADPKRIDYYSRNVTPESVIIMFDRSSAADDNAEYFYRYMQEEHPEYSKTYFALAKSSVDWPRLEADGFRLVEMFSKDFYNLFLDSDLVIGSQMYNIRFRGKNFSNSRFLYLQHGIQLNDMTSWVASKFFDLFIVTGRPEEEYMRAIAPEATYNSGIPRLDSIRRCSTVADGDILFMPTWRFILNSVSDYEFRHTDYFAQIQSLITDESLGAYLMENDKRLVVKLHPNLVRRASLFELPEWSVLSSSSYRESIANAAMVITDYSSVVADAAFIGIPIVYFQWDESVFFDDQPYTRRLEYRTQGMGPVFTERGQLVDYIVGERSWGDRDLYEDRRRWFFSGVEQGTINRRIYERMLEL